MAIELGSAYVTVIPEMQGAQREIGKALGDKAMGSKAGMDVGAAMSDGIVGKLKGIAKLIAGLAATKAIIDFGRAALDAYASYEQLVGGVDTLFGEASGQVQEFAANAFQTAGMSANEYMETVTGFSASLIQSLDGDTARAAQVADMAIRDMSDNANKMGSDMESIQNAYQGFAKQNYTMLDNLKLGYGGTKEEMERLLADAEAISGVHYSIDSYADVVEAIHVIQDEMGVAGATAEEAASTIEGSVGMMRAAWENWVTGIGNEDADMADLSNKLVESVMTAAKNVVPRIGAIARGMLSSIPPTLTGLLHDAFTNLPDLVRATFGDAAADGLVEFMKPFMGLRLSVQRVVEPVRAALGSMMERIQGHMEELQPVVDDLKDAIGRFADAFGYLFEQAAPVIAEIAGNLVSGLVGLSPLVVGLATLVTDLASAIMTALGGAIQFCVWAFTKGVPAAIEALKSKWDELKAKVSEMARAVTDRFASIKSSISSSVESIRGNVSSKFVAIKSAITKPIEDAKNAVKGAIDKIKGFLNVKLEFPKIKTPHFKITGGEIPWGIGGAGTPPHVSVDWYGSGGFASTPTLSGYGERGVELYWPGYEPYFDKYAAGIAAHMPSASIDYDRLGAAVARAMVGMAVNIDGHALIGQVMASASRTARMNGGR